MTVDELIATLKRSSLPTVLVEGPDDVIVFRALEQRYVSYNLSVLPVGGRKNVLGVFERRSEIPNTRTIFIADRDFWCLSCIPIEYQDSSLIFTEGYSIENDLHVDYDFCRLLTADERKQFCAELNKFVRWYALACSRQQVNASVAIELHPHSALSTQEIFDNHCLLQDGELYPEIVYRRIIQDYRNLLRGKSLLALFLRQLSHQRRTPKYSGASLLEVAAAHSGPRLQRIFDEVGSCVSAGTLNGCNAAPSRT